MNEKQKIDMEELDYDALYAKQMDESIKEYKEQMGVDWIPEEVE